MGGRVGTGCVLGRDAASADRCVAAGFATWRGRDEPGRRYRRRMGELGVRMGVGLSSGTGRPGRHLPRRDDPIGSLTGGLCERLRLRSARGGSIRGVGHRVDALSFAAKVEQAAAGLSRRGMCFGDVVGVLAPVSPDRFLATYTVMAVGGRALPLSTASDLDTQCAVLTETDTRLLLVSADMAQTALELAERSRVRQVIAFGQALGTTPFEELLQPSPDGNGYSPARGLFDNGILGYEDTSGGLLTTLHPHNDLMGRFSELRDLLELTADDVVAVDERGDEATRVALVALALWTGACVLTGADCPPPEGRQVTVRCAPEPERIGYPPIGGAY
ncbi:AMP-dependent synthetase [Nocardiopsis dassonvillei]|nr:MULTISPECIES: AMP-binding protein [Nocardiopsis]ASU60006.1 AMP-dependent synthetase [Nocardiopsis dassonvillei]